MTERRRKKKATTTTKNEINTIVKWAKICVEYTSIDMALRLLCAAARNWKNYAISNGASRQFLRSDQTSTTTIANNLLKVQVPVTIDTIRSVSFLNKSMHT